MVNDLSEYIHAPVSWKFVSPTLAFQVEKDGRLALMVAYGRVLSLFHDQLHGVGVLGNVFGKQSLNSSKTSSTCRLEASVSVDGFDAEMDSGSVNSSTHPKKLSHQRRRSLTALFPEMKRSEAVSVLESGKDPEDSVH